MKSIPDLDETTNKLNGLLEVKKQELQRNQQFINTSREIIANLKMARLEARYFVACTMDCLNDLTPYYSNLAQPNPNLIDFGEAKTRRKRKSKRAV